ncbi:hypothetical protein V8C86DRAFT_3120417 [Haematococcus lacustris]
MRPARKRAAAVRSFPAATLLSLSAPLLDDIASRAVQLGAGEALSLTCRALSLVVLQHAPALSIELGQANQSRLLAPRVVSALQTRTCKLTLTLRQPPEQESRQYMEELTTALAKLGSIPAVRRCKLVSVINGEDLDCTPGLAQRLLNSFPRLSALFINGYSIPCSSLASMFSHPQLALQLQQLDLTGTTVLHANEDEDSDQSEESEEAEQFEYYEDSEDSEQSADPGQPGQPGAIALTHLFHGLKLKQLSLDVHKKKLMPHLQPLAPHLTQLCIGLMWSHEQPRAFARLVGAQPQLQVLTVMQTSLQEVLQLLPALPRLHTLQLPQAYHLEPEDWELASLLAATQLTSIQLGSIIDLTIRRTDAACSWQRLELTRTMDCISAGCLPLHSLTQPLVLGELYICAAGEYVNRSVRRFDIDVFELDNPFEEGVEEEGEEVVEEEGEEGVEEEGEEGVEEEVEEQVKEEVKEGVEEEEEQGVEEEEGAGEVVVDCLYNLLQACQVPVRIGKLTIAMGHKARQVLSLLQPLGACVGEVEVLELYGLGVADAPALAQLCQSCTGLKFRNGSLTPSLEFWHQLVQLMPAVTPVTFEHTAGSCSLAMRQLLWRLSKEAWAQGLDITIMHTAWDVVKEWRRVNHSLGHSTPGRFRARAEHA